MSVGFIMYEIVDKDSLKNQGINTTSIHYPKDNQVGYSLKYQGINTTDMIWKEYQVLDIHLNIKVLTPNLIKTPNLFRWIFT